MANQVFSPQAFSPDPTYYLSLDEPDRDDRELRERQHRYAALKPYVSEDDIIEQVCAKLRESVALRVMVRDSLEDPQDNLQRPTMHVSDLIRTGQAVLNLVVECVDEQVGMLAVTHGED